MEISKTTYLLIVRVSNSKDTYPYKLVSVTIPRVGEIITYIEHQTYTEHKFIVDKVEHLYSEHSRADNLMQKGYTIVDGYPRLDIHVTRIPVTE